MYAYLELFTVVFENIFLFFLLEVRGTVVLVVSVIAIIYVMRLDVMNSHRYEATSFLCSCTGRLYTCRSSFQIKSMRGRSYVKMMSIVVQTKKKKYCHSVYCDQQIVSCLHHSCFCCFFFNFLFTFLHLHFFSFLFHLSYVYREWRGKPVFDGISPSENKAF